MLDGTFKSLTAIVILAGALTAKSEATTTRHSPVISGSSVASTPKVSHRLPPIDDGCVELRGPAPAKVEAPAAPAAGGTCS